MRTAELFMRAEAARRRKAAFEVWRRGLMRALLIGLGSLAAFCGSIEFVEPGDGPIIGAALILGGCYMVLGGFFPKEGGRV